MADLIKYNEVYHVTYSPTREGDYTFWGDVPMVTLMRVLNLHKDACRRIEHEVPTVGICNLCVTRAGHMGGYYMVQPLVKK